MSIPDYSQAVKDIIDGLGDSPTPDEIYHAVRNYSVDHVVAAAAAAAKAGGGGGGGSQTATVTTDADTFTAAHIFDLGAGAHLAFVTLTCTAVVPDGESFGTGNGAVIAEPGGPDHGSGFGTHFNPGTSLSGLSDEYAYQLTTNLCSIANGAPSWTDGGLSAVGESITYALVVFRYVEIGVKLFTRPNGDDYAGANHPTITVRIDVTT